MKKRIIVIYHANCADGFGAAWCFWNAYGDDAEYYPASHGTKPPDVTGRDVYMVDFCYKRKDVISLVSKARSVTLIDHHKTAIEDVKGIIGLFQLCDINRSGAGLAWDYLNPGDERPVLISHIEDRDLWQFRLPGTRDIQAALFSYPYDFQVWNRLITGGLQQTDKLRVEGEALTRKQAKDIDELLGVCQRTMEIDGVTIPVASLPYTLSSEACHIMAEGQPFAACYWDTPDGRSFSLRSAQDGVDVSAVAQLFGGGGHKHAAGFSVPRSHRLAVS